MVFLLFYASAIVNCYCRLGVLWGAVGYGMNARCGPRCFKGGGGAT